MERDCDREEVLEQSIEFTSHGLAILRVVCCCCGVVRLAREMLQTFSLIILRAAMYVHLYNVYNQTNASVL